MYVCGTDRLEPEALGYKDKVSMESTQCTYVEQTGWSSKHCLVNIEILGDMAVSALTFHVHEEMLRMPRGNASCIEFVFLVVFFQLNSLLLLEAAFIPILYVL